MNEPLDKKEIVEKRQVISGGASQRRSRSFLIVKCRRLAKEKHCLRNRLASLQKTNLKLREALHAVAEDQNYLKMLTRYQSIRAQARYWEKAYGQKKS